VFANLEAAMNAEFKKSASPEEFAGKIAAWSRPSQRSSTARGLLRGRAGAMLLSLNHTASGLGFIQLRKIGFAWGLHAKEEAKVWRMVGVQIEANASDGHFGRSSSATRTAEILS
jgi:hypothetical protein